MSDQKQILVFKLTSGEEIISRMVADELCFYLEDPYQIMIYPDDSGRTQLGLMPFMGYSQDDSIVLSRIGTHFALPNSELEKAYLSATSGIQLVSPGIQLQ